MNIDKIVKEIKKGNLVIIPTDTVYGISADMTNEKAIEKVYNAKNRDKNKPLILLVSNVDMLKEYTEKLNSLEEEIINKYLPGKLTILLHKNSKVSDKITGKSDLVGIRMPNSKQLIQIIDKVGNPIISTSANISGKATITNPKDVEKEMLKHISYVEDAGTLNNEPSSIIKIENDKIIVIRKESVAKQILKDYRDKF